MARIAIRGSELVVRLSILEKMASLRGDLHVPLASIREVEVVDDVLASVRGIRAPGYGMPFVSKVGTWRRRDGKTFAVAHRWNRGGVRIALEDQGYDEIVLGSGDPAKLARSIRERRDGESNALPVA